MIAEYYVLPVCLHLRLLWILKDIWSIYFDFWTNTQCYRNFTSGLCVYELFNFTCEGATGSLRLTLPRDIVTANFYERPWRVREIDLMRFT